MLVSNEEIIIKCFLTCVEQSVGLGKGKRGALECMRPAGVLDPLCSNVRCLPLWASASLHSDERAEQNDFSEHAQLLEWEQNRSW